MTGFGPGNHIEFDGAFSDFEAVQVVVSTSVATFIRVLLPHQDRRLDRATGGERTH